MATVNSVKARIETDLSDSEIQDLIDEATLALVSAYGPNANPAVPLTVRLEGDRKKLVVDRPIDTTRLVVIKEYVTEFGYGETVYTLNALDYRIWPDGYIIERLSTGPNAWSKWNKQVELSYVPINDGDQRDEVIIKLVMLAINYDGGFSGLRSKTVGDVTTSEADYQDQRNKILSSLQPWGGLLMR